MRTQVKWQVSSCVHCYWRRLGSSLTGILVVDAAAAGPLLQRFLPLSLELTLKEGGPESMLKLFDKDSETPEVIWNGEMRAELRTALADQLDAFVKERADPHAETEEFRLSPNAGTTYKNLTDELYIGGVYVRLFLKEPTFNLRDPTGFLEKLMIRWTHELEVYTSSAKHSSESDPSASNGAVMEAQQDVLQLVTSASVYLCKVRDSLCDKLAPWGYMARGIVLLRDVLECELLGAPLLSIMRIFHVASNRQVNVEALALAGGSDGKGGIVYYTMQAIGKDPLHTDSAFMLEVLLKVYRKALGDVKNAPKGESSVSENQGTALNGPMPTVNQYSGPAAAADPNASLSVGSYAMAPSPAPGLEPVRKRAASKGKIDHPLDHPLAFGGPDVPSNNQAAPVRSSASNNNRRQQMSGQSSSRSGHPLASPLGAPSQSRQATGYASNQNTYPVQTQSTHGSATRSPNPLMTSAAPIQQPPPVAAAADFYSQMAQNPLAQPPQHVTSSQSPVVPAPIPQSHPSVNNTTVVPSYTMQSGGNRGNVMQQQRQQQHAVFGGQVSSQNTTKSQTSFVSQQAPGAQHHSFQDPRYSVPIQQPSHGMQQPGQQQASQQQTPPQPSFGTQQAAGAQQASQMFSPTQLQTYAVQGGQGPQPTSIGTQQTPVQHSGQVFPPAQQQVQSGPGMQPMPQRSVHQMFPPTQHQQPQGAYALNQQAQVQPTAVVTAPVHAPQSTVSPRTNESQGVQQGSAQEPDVETVHPSPAPAAARPYRPTPVEGSGIDARSAPTPKQKAEQQILSNAGAPGSAQGRIALLQSALACELPKFVVEGVLENPTLANVKDPAATKVHGVELLKLLTMDPGYGLKFKLILDELPAWKKYKSQDHSLFITGAEQKADYFLTDGDNKEPAKLLTEG